MVYGWPPDSSWYRQNEITLVMTLISMIVPNIFDIISLLEDYHPRKAMRWMLARIMVLNLLSLYTLIFALFGKTFDMQKELLEIQRQMNQGVDYGLDIKPNISEVRKDCYKIPIPCELLGTIHTLQRTLGLTPYQSNCYLYY